MRAERLDEGALAGSRYARDADAQRVASVGQAGLDDLLRHLLVVGMGALYQRDGTAQNDTVAPPDARHVVLYREVATPLPLQVRVYLSRLLNALALVQRTVKGFLYHEVEQDTLLATTSSPLTSTVLSLSMLAQSLALMSLPSQLS